MSPTSSSSKTDLLQLSRTVIVCMLHCHAHIDLHLVSDVSDINLSVTDITVLIYVAPTVLGTLLTLLTLY